MVSSADLAKERSQPRQLRLAKARSHQAVSPCHQPKENCCALSQGLPHRRRSNSFVLFCFFARHRSLVFFQDQNKKSRNHPIVSGSFCLRYYAKFKRLYIDSQKSASFQNRLSFIYRTSMSNWEYLDFNFRITNISQYSIVSNSIAPFPTLISSQTFSVLTRVSRIF